MTIDCPRCRLALALRISTPGRHRQTCPSCREPFVVNVPEPAGAVPKNAAPKAAAKASQNGHPAAKKKRTENPPAPRRAPAPPPVDDDNDFVVSAPGAPDAGPPDEDEVIDFEVKAPTFPGARDEEAPEGDAQDADDGEVPARLGGYEVLRVLGKGGMGAVLLGRQVSLNRRVAIKVMHPKIAENPSHVARFTREAYAAAQLTHHNVVQVYDIGEDRGQHFFSMEFVPGRSLMDVVRREGKLAPEVAVGYVLQAARGLRHGHKQGMVHRDIKPANLLVNDEGIVKVADLGLVKLGAGEADPEGGPGADGDDDAELTRVGTAVGTPAFMAPEQATSSSTVDARADVYSLGCTLYALVTGRPPFDGKTAPEVMSKHLTEPVVPPEVLVKRVPSALSAILMRMLAKDPDERYQSMDQVIAILEEFLGVPRSGTFTPTESDADVVEECATAYHRQNRDRRKWLIALGFLAVCAAGVIAGAVLGRPVTAVKTFLLLCLAPPTYFVVHGLLSGGVVFTRVRALALGMRPFDWFMVLGGAALLLGTLALFGLFAVWVKLVILSLLLAYFLWALTDLAQEEAQRDPLREARRLCRRLRIQGLSEDQLREFVCKYAGPHWEELFEALFGFEAKLGARALRTGQTAEPWTRHAAWREPIAAWADARLDARRRAREQKYLQRIEARALEAKGVNRTEAAERAAALAAALVDQADEAGKARREGREVDLRGMVKSARSGKPKPGYNAGARRLRGRWLRDFCDDWLGRRLRFALGAALFAAGLLWMHQNELLDRDNPLVAQVRTGQLVPALATLSEPTGKPLSASPVPAQVTEQVNSYRVPITGFFLIASALFYFGWRSSVPALAGAAVALAGPDLGVPEVGPVGAAFVALASGIGIVMIFGWLLRK